MAVPLFVAEPTGTCRLSLRRYRFDEDAEHTHEATVLIDENATSSPRTERGTVALTDDRVPRDDPRWPAACPCGEPFRDDDEWQCLEADWYEGAGARFAWGLGSWDGAPGAMIRASWRDLPHRPPAWIVFLPNGTWWCTNDRAAADGNQAGPYWDISGEAPDITVNPSIDDRSPARPWHGWLRRGQMIDA